MGFMNKVKDMMGRHGERTGEAGDDRTRGRHRRHTGTREAEIREARERMTRERDEKGDTAGPAA
jgi:hypothetical protein